MFFFNLNLKLNAVDHRGHRELEKIIVIIVNKSFASDCGCCQFEQKGERQKEKETDRQRVDMDGWMNDSSGKSD